MIVVAFLMIIKTTIALDPLLYFSDFVKWHESMK